MADAKKPQPGNSPGKKKSGGKLKLYAFLIVAMFVAPFMFPTVILVFAGLLPTLVAVLVDKDREHSYATAIGAMNCAGITPFVIDLWIKGQSMATVMQILTTPTSWLIILGAAAIGQMIVSVVPQAMATLTLAHMDVRIKVLKNNLDLLQKSWGTDVGTTKPIEKIVKME